MEVNASNIHGEIEKANKPVFALFWASWCTACKRSEVVVGEIEEERDDIKVLEANVDRNPVLRDEFDLQGVPTFIMFNGGKEVERKVGAQARKQLIKMIDSVVDR